MGSVSSSLTRRVADAQAVLGLAVARHRQFEAQMNGLAAKACNTVDFERYLDRVLGPESRRQASDTPELSAARARITANFDHEFQRLPGIAHTAWSAFNSVTQYVDWERPTRGKHQQERDERRFATTMFGPGAELKRRAWQEALVLAELA